MAVPSTRVPPPAPAPAAAPNPDRNPASAAPMWALRAVVFTVGAASLGAEITAARLLAPYFGASTVIWANTIATVLVSLAIGYSAGGRVADRGASLPGLCRIVLAAAALMAAVPFAADPFLRLSVRALGSLSLGGFLGSLAAVLVLVAVPVVLLGAVAPYANRLALGAVERTGTVTGGLYATSTAGSLLGTFAAALVLIPLVGSHRTLLVFALALALVAATLAGAKRLLTVPAVLAALLLVPPAAVGVDVYGARVVYSTETQYQYARVLQFADGERQLQLNEGVAVHSLYRPRSYLTGNYWDDFLVLPFAAGRGPPGRVAILGDAAGTVARAYGHYFPGTRVDAVELDGALTDIGRRWFDLRGPRLHLYTADARPWLAAQRARYGAIFLDAYRQPYIPFYLVTREFFRSVAEHLLPGGIVIVNVGHIPGSHALERVVAGTLRAVFPAVVSDRVDATNSLIAAAAGPLRTSELRSAGLPPELAALAASVAARTSQGARGGEVWSDDRAPVEWLTDLSILGYATSGR